MGGCFGEASLLFHYVSTLHVLCWPSVLSVLIVAPCCCSPSTLSLPFPLFPPLFPPGWDNEIDIQKTIQLVRAQRSGMVQTEVS